MSEGAVESGQGAEQQFDSPPVAPDSQGGGESINPAWNDLLSIVPSQLHSQVTPHLKKWDSNFQTKLNEVHSQYEGYKPYLENQIDPERINYALQMLEAIDARPMDVIEALNQYVDQAGLRPQEQEQGLSTGEEEPPGDFLQHPEFQKMQQMLNTMAQYMVQQNQATQDSQYDQELADEIEQLQQTHGEFDVDWVLTKALQAANNGGSIDSLEPFVKEYRAFEQNVIANSRRPGPRVLPSGGRAPDNQVDPKQLDDQGRRSLVAQMLQAAHQDS